MEDITMLKLETKSKLPPEKIVDELKGFFGEDGMGLNLEEESSQCLSFQGGGGYVTATLCPEERETRIEFVTQEWEIQVKKFTSELK
jgi:hypothetical protein